MTTMTQQDVAKTMRGLTKRMADAAVELAVYTMLGESDGWISIHQGALRNLTARGLVSSATASSPEKYLTHEALEWLQKNHAGSLLNAMMVMCNRRRRRFQVLSRQAEKARERLHAINDLLYADDEDDSPNTDILHGDY